MGIYDSSLHHSIEAFAAWTAREKRYAIAAQTVITTIDGKSAFALVLNVSQRGCRIRTSVSIHPGDRLTFVVEPHGKVDAEVCWTAGSDAGLKLVARDPFYGDYHLSYPL